MNQTAPKSKFTPTQARKALLNDIIKARIGTTSSPIPNGDLQEVIALLTQMEDELKTLKAAQ